MLLFCFGGVGNVDAESDAKRELMVGHDLRLFLILEATSYVLIRHSGGTLLSLAFWQRRAI